MIGILLKKHVKANRGGSEHAGWTKSHPAALRTPTMEQYVRDMSGKLAASRQLETSLRFLVFFMQADPEHYWVFGAGPCHHVPSRVQLDPRIHRPEYLE